MERRDIVDKKKGMHGGIAKKLQRTHVQGKSKQAVTRGEQHKKQKWNGGGPQKDPKPERWATAGEGGRQIEKRGLYLSCRTGEERCRVS